MNCVGDHVLKIDIGTTQDLASDFRVPSLPILARQNIRSLPNSGYFHQKLDTKNRLLTSCCSGLLAWFTHVGIPVEENSLVKQTESHTEIDFDLLSKLHKLAENCLQDCAPYHPEAPKIWRMTRWLHLLVRPWGKFGSYVRGSIRLLPQKPSLHYPEASSRTRTIEKICQPATTPLLTRCSQIGRWRRSKSKRLSWTRLFKSSAFVRQQR